jgi:hypothetical protein
MATDAAARRRLLLTGVAALAAPRLLRAAPAQRTTLAAAFDRDGRSWLGLLREQDRRLLLGAALELPTRAHGLLADGRGALLAVARRPGDWLLRWTPSRGSGPDALQWQWIEPERAFNGHALLDAQRRRLYTSETDLVSGHGLVGVRDAGSLRKLDEWPTQGLDPHALVWDGAGRLFVANGGIPTRPETGRAKRDLDRMDSSLVRLDPRSGRVDAQWRLADRRLSLRHLARQRDTLAVALQAEHDDPAERAAAPVLALLDAGRGLRAAAAPMPLAGYGGDVCADGPGFAVSCPRADGVARFDGGGGWRGLVAAPKACALAPDDAALWVGGGAVLRAAQAPRGELRAIGVDEAWALDNHWMAWA